MKVKTSELQGPALDWAVAKCEGYTDYCPETEKMLPPRKEYGWVSLCEYHYSSDWAQGGPIVERERIDLSWAFSSPHDWSAWPKNDGTRRTDGPTPLIAAMRCFVASRLGDEVEVPDELVGGAA